MKVLYVSPYPPSRDGIGDYTWMLAKAARGAGHEVRIVAPRVMRDAPPEVIGTTAVSGQEFARLRRSLAHWRPDIVHIQFAIAAFGLRTFTLMRWLATLRRDLEVPLVVTLHEPVRESALLPGFGSFVARWLAERCDQVIVHTAMAYGALVHKAGLPEKTISLMPQPKVQFRAATCSPGQLRARHGLDDARVLLAFGFIHTDKGLDDLVKALRVLRETRPAVTDKVKVVIAGAVRPRAGVFRAFEARDNLYLARLLRLARRTGVHDLLVLTGYVPDGEVQAWFEAADAVVLPYRRVDQSGVAWMARSLNVPVLSSNVGGLAENFADSPWTFPPRTPARIAETVADFLDASSPRPGGEQALAPGRARDAATTALLALYSRLSCADPAGSRRGR